MAWTPAGNLRGPAGPPGPGVLALPADTSEVPPGTAAGTVIFRPGARPSLADAWRGAWSAQVAYVPGDLVSHAGSTYLAIQASTGVTPSAQTASTWVAFGGGGGGALPSRRTANLTTGTLQPQGVIMTTIAMAPSYRVLRLQTSIQARVRLYVGASHQTTDVSRLVTVTPTGNHGVMLDVVTTSDRLLWDLSPTVDGYTSDAVTNVPITITNLSEAASACSVTLTYLPTEA